MANFSWKHAFWGMLMMTTANAAEPTRKVDWASLADPPLLQDGVLADGAVQGKVVLLVNVASRCGYTPQYEGLQALWKKYQDKGLVVVGAPCNQFGQQEPGTSEEIATFCKTKYDVDFPMLSRQDVNGDNRSAIYAAALGDGPPISWNFEKVLIGKDGTVVGRFSSRVKPDSAELLAAIDAALQK